MFNLQQFETLTLCVECGSFSAAARKLGKAQSAVSTTISNLEIDTGILIFDRSSRTPVLTEQGKHLYLRAVALLEHAQSINAMVQAFNAGVEAKITIAIHALLLNDRFYRMLAEFSSHFPDTELNLVVENNENIATLVRSHQADIGFTPLSADYLEGIDVGSIGYLPFSIAVRENHPLFNQPQASFEQLKRFRQILLPDKSSHYNGTFAPRVTRVNHLESALELVQLSDCWLLAPNHVINKYSKLKILKLPNEECDWLIQIDRIVAKEKSLGVALKWIQQKSSECYFHRIDNSV